MRVQIVCGDCRPALRKMPAGSVHCCITSPPYWGLRDYGLEPVVWGGDSLCRHKWQEQQHSPQPHGDDGSGGNLQGGRATQMQTRMGDVCQAFCARCGAWRGVLGLEPSVELYVSHLVEAFRHVRRVLRDDGTVWLNLGDSYNGYYANQYATSISAHNQHARPKVESGEGLRCKGLKPKDLCGIPWRVALALQADGWWLRNDIIWAKGNPMPESVTDRCTTSHEHVFLLAKAGRYFYDQEAIREPHKPASLQRVKRGLNTDRQRDYPGAPQTLRMGDGQQMCHPAGRNRRDVWHINTEPFPDAHFATFPTKLVELCVKAGTSERGVCPECGAPWERVVERENSSRTLAQGHKGLRSDAIKAMPNKGTSSAGQ